MTRRFLPGVALALGALLGGRAANAQNYFGQNQVQYDSFNWLVLDTEHFQIYYYTEERKAAWDAARMAERAYARLSRVLARRSRSCSSRRAPTSGRTTSPETWAKAPAVSPKRRATECW